MLAAPPLGTGWWPETTSGNVIVEILNASNMVDLEIGWTLVGLKFFRAAAVTGLLVNPIQTSPRD
jgi:hypothetical protein